MIKEVIFSGITNRPSDYESPDGQLAAAVNISNDDGQLAPMFKPTELCKFDSGLNVVYIHKTATFTHYIVQGPHDNSTTAYYWIDEEAALSESSPIPAPAPRNNSPLHYIDGLDNIDHKTINSIGITLLIIDDNNVHYVVWKASTADNATPTYKYLGTHIPELPISFGIDTTGIEGNHFYDDGGNNIYSFLTAQSENDDIRFIPWGTNRRSVDLQHGSNYNNPYEAEVSLNDNDSETYSNEILPKLQRYIHEKFTQKNIFFYPFLVRYAYRLFDGSLVMHSSPVLMVSCERPICYGYTVRTSEASFRYESIVEAIFMAGKLDYSVIGNIPSDLQDWSDIIKSVDIFVSPQFSNIDFNGKIKEYKHVSPENGGICIGKHMNTGLDGDGNNIYAKGYTIGSNGIYPVPNGLNEFVLPELTGDKEAYYRRIRENSSFYLLSSIDIKTIATGRNVVPIADGRLENISTQESFQEIYPDSHDFIIPKCTFNYNSRMNFANITKRYARPLVPLAYIPFQEPTQQAVVTYSDNTTSVIQIPLEVDLGNTDATNSYIGILNGLRPDDSTIQSIVSATEEGSNDDILRIDDQIRIVLHIKSDSGDIVLYSDWGYYNFGYNPFIYFQHYADRAYKVGVEIRYHVGGSRGYYEFNLSPHETLNGAIAFNGFNTEYSPQNISFISDTPTEINNLVRYPNKIYTSEVGNPFAFPVLGINTVGTGDIIGVCSTARALSTGQFGQFPLYVFATDGVWALALSNEGLYSSVHPVTRDVCTNPDSITPTDTSILFATERGIILLSGSDSVCITEEISSLTPYDILAQGTGLPLINGAVSMLDDDSQSCLPVVPFLEYLKECRLLYDYMHQRIILYNPSVDNNGNRKHGYAYAYSLKSRAWGTFYCNAHLGINSYPDTLAMTDDNILVSYSDIADVGAVGSLSAKVLFVTRPLKLENPDALKSVHTVILRGFFPLTTDDNPVAPTAGIILYGSRDLQHWHLVASSRNHQLRGVRGTPYKYFRIAVIATLHEGDTISGATVEYDVRQTNKLH